MRRLVYSLVMLGSVLLMAREGVGLGLLIFSRLLGMRGLVRLGGWPVSTLISLGVGIDLLHCPKASHFCLLLIMLSIIMFGFLIAIVCAFYVLIPCLFGGCFPFRLFMVDSSFLMMKWHFCCATVCYAFGLLFSYAGISLFGKRRRTIYLDRHV
jgi:hypothetical protein